MSSIALGVAALVAIDSYAGNITQSIREQSKALLGGDVAFTTRRDFPPPIDSLFDSLGTQGVTIARITTFASMAMIPRSGGTRLVQVRGVSKAYPLYGAIVTDPASAFATFQQGAHALIDPSLLISLNAEVGDTLTLGYGRFVITGALTTIPGDPGVAAAVAPRILIPERFIADTKLLTVGSRAEYEAFAKLPASAVPGKFVAQIRPTLDKSRVRARTVVQNEEGLTASIDQLSDFLGIVGIVALLLGGIGVASGVHAWVARKIDTVAVLRCLGATSGQVLLIYATQAAVMGLVGASIGAVIGIGIQFALPQVVGDLLPVDVRTQLEPRAILTGLGLGVWIALAFALRPLIALRRVSPLQALRRELDPAPIRRGWRDWPRLLVNFLILASVVGIASTRSQGWQQLAGFSGGIAGVVLVLALSAGFLSWLARKALRAGWPYVVRQGVANLYRPANQTRAVVLSLGFGAFLITTLYLVQSNLLQQLTITTEASRGNLLFFDVQDDQGPGVDSIVRAAGHEIVQRVPIVTMRVSAINGRPVNVARMDSLARSTDRDTARGAAAARDTERRDNAWAFRREYRSTYRAEMVPTERLLSGKWFAGDTTGLPQVSLEREIAQNLGVSLGDTITWDV